MKNSKKDSRVPRPIRPKFVPKARVPRPARGIIRFRVISYNILAQAYTRPAYYSYCPIDCLNWSNRSKATLTLLKSFRSDFLCLQELDTYDFYKKGLETHGYGSVYIQRSGYKPDGCGIFYRHNVIELLMEDTIKYNDLAKAVKSVHEFDYLRRDCVGIMAAFRFKGAPFNHVVIVANTHIFWDPRWSNVKFEQVKYLTKRLVEFEKRVSEKFGCEEPSLIVAGDFNSFPNSMVYQYLIKSCPDYKTRIANNETMTCFEEPLEKPPMPLCSVYAFIGGREPKFTNCKPDFKETLDYIFFSPSKFIKPISVLQLPDSPESPDVIGGLPNSYHPSDHLPIGAEFEIRRE